MFSLLEYGICNLLIFFHFITTSLVLEIHFKFMYVHFTNISYTMHRAINKVTPINYMQSFFSIEYYILLYLHVGIRTIAIVKTKTTARQLLIPSLMHFCLRL